MASYTAEDVKRLREATAAGMLDCKKALDEADGNYEKAVREGVRFMYNAPIIFISALKGENLLSVIDTAYELAEKS